MRLFKLMGDKSKFVTETEYKAVKLAKENLLKKVEITYTDTFINKLKEILKAKNGSDKKIIEDFINQLTNDR